MTDHKYELKRYTGRADRNTCPACGTKHSFSRYIDAAGREIGDDVGRCNRESSCGYHYKPREFFAANPDRPEPTAVIKKKEPDESFQDYDTIPLKYISESFANCFTGPKTTPLLEYLSKLFESKEDYIKQTVCSYYVGSWEISGKDFTVFWQIDRHSVVRTGKMIAYTEQGKRNKNVNPQWAHKVVMAEPDSFRLKQCFFGEHLLVGKKQKPVAICESEKTAVLMSAFNSRYIWLACGGMRHLNVARVADLSVDRVFLFPDTDGYDQWRKLAGDLRRSGVQCRISPLVEEVSAKGVQLDMADLVVAALTGDSLKPQVRVDVTAIDIHTHLKYLEIS